MRWEMPSRRTPLLVAMLLVPTLLHIGAAHAHAVKFSADLAEPVMLEGKKQPAYLKVRLEGEAVPGAERAATNVAIVLDKSGSMQGEKLQHAKEAAFMAIEKLNEDDIVSVVLYDTTVDVLVPATKASDKAAIRQRLFPVQAGGNTALFGGVSKAAGEVRKFLELDRVNRVVLLSDGLANEGPRSPRELGDLGASLEKQGIAVTTIGLGLDYNEDLMAQLARRSHGSHIFAERPADLEEAFAREFGDVLTTVAQDARVTVRCAPGVRPVRVIGRDGEIDGQEVRVDLGQVFGKQVRYAIIELEVPEGNMGDTLDVASAELTCYSLVSKEEECHTDQASARFTNVMAEVDAARDERTMVSVVRQLATEQTALARELRDLGQVEEARTTLKRNGSLIMEWNGKLNSPVLQQDFYSNSFDLQNLDNANWKQQRKLMVDKETVNQLQALGYVD